MIVQANTRADAATLATTAHALVGAGKGLLAMDESTPIYNKRFAAVGIPQTEDARRACRELLITTPRLGDCISGALLYDGTIRQQTTDGIPFAERPAACGIVPGIKVDTGATSLAAHLGEKVIEGHDGLRDRLEQYFNMGARFAKWRAAFGIGDGLPSTACVGANAQALARYAALCQATDLVPNVEPEVLMVGRQTMQRSGEVTHAVLRGVFDAMNAQGVTLEAMILKLNMVLPGLDCPEQDGVEAVASATLACLQMTVPAAVAGVAFLSDGQPVEVASARLNAMNIGHGSLADRSPWPLVFSFGRAIQQPPLQISDGGKARRVAARQALYYRASCNRAAMRGEYRAAMEAESAGHLVS